VGGIFGSMATLTDVGKNLYPIPTNVDNAGSVRVATPMEGGPGRPSLLNARTVFSITKIYDPVLSLNLRLIIRRG